MYQYLHHYKAHEVGINLTKIAKYTRNTHLCVTEAHKDSEEY